MRGSGLKAVAAAIAAVFVVSFTSVFGVGSREVMAIDDLITIEPGVVIEFGDIVRLDNDIYLFVDDSSSDTSTISAGLFYIMGINWDSDRQQWDLTLVCNTSFFHIYQGFGETTGTEHPVGVRCTGGDGLTPETAFTFELVTDSMTEVRPGSVLYPGEYFTFNSDSYVLIDDADGDVILLASGDYLMSNNICMSRGTYGLEWYTSYFPMGNSSEYDTFLLDLGLVTENEIPFALICTGGDGKTEETAFTFDVLTATTMYRLYNPNSGEHFYTSNTAERDTLIAVGWNDEGIGWYAPPYSNTPVYRLYNRNGGEHHFTTSVGERNSLIALGWEDEGISCYSNDRQSIPVYRQYNPNAFANNHNYTTSLQENNDLVALGWRAEGIGWYGVSVCEDSN